MIVIGATIAQTIPHVIQHKEEIRYYIKIWAIPCFQVIALLKRVHKYFFSRGQVYSHKLLS